MHHLNVCVTVGTLCLPGVSFAWLLLNCSSKNTHPVHPWHMPLPPPLLILCSPTFSQRSPCAAVYGAAWRLCMGVPPISTHAPLPTLTQCSFPPSNVHSHVNLPSPSSVSKPLHPLSYLLPLCLRLAGMWWWHWCVLFLFPFFTNRRRPDWSMPTLRSLNRACSLKRPKLRNSKGS